MNKFEEAIASYNKALALTNAQKPHEYGEALMNIDKLPEALEEFDAAIENNPESAGAYFDKGAVLTKMCKPSEQIIDAYELAIKYKPDFSDAHCNKGVKLLELGKLEDAVILISIKQLL